MCDNCKQHVLEQIQREDRDRAYAEAEAQRRADELRRLGLGAHADEYEKNAANWRKQNGG